MAKNQLLQNTVSRPLSFYGVGLHSGLKCKIRVFPSASDTGIVFDLQKKRTEVVSSERKSSSNLWNSGKSCVNDNVLSADFRNVSSTTLSTTLSDKGGKAISTVEHFLAALYAVNIHNAYVVTDQSEIPVLDGSSSFFANVCRRNICLSFPKKKLPIVVVTKPVTIKYESSFAEMLPSEEKCLGKLTVSLALDSYCNRLPAVSINNHSFTNPKAWIEEVGQARTFAFESDIAFLRANNLGLGGSLHNCVVYAENKEDKVSVINRKGLRFENEWARHKLLDIHGDLYLSRPFGILHAHYKVFRPGHSINNKILHALFSDESAFQIIQ